MLDAITSCDSGPLYRLQGIDRSLIGANGLYLASNRPMLAASADITWPLHAGDWLGSGTLRNSFFAEPWLQMTRVRDICLLLTLRGSFRIRVMQATNRKPARVLKEQRIDCPDPADVAVTLGALQDLPPGSRLFWHLEATDGGQLHQACWCTRDRPTPTGDGSAMAVLMRTFGRGAELRALMRQWLDQAGADGHLRATLARLAFRVLDASPGAEDDWSAPALAGFDLAVWQGPNLGGGGNAAHLMQLFMDEADAAGDEPPEVLILDDDLSISLESIARYLAHCAYRATDALCSLPILMKSRPTTIWEDGGMWGVEELPATRPHGEPPRRQLAPHLIRHGVALDGYEHLDGMGGLNRCEYSTFVFLGLPTRCLRRIGLPAAFFLRGDDIEFCLRAGQAGFQVWTNPNLAAWHEPGHSPAQEYMAILHAVLINLRYSSNPADDYLRFFEQRMAEHAALADHDGLRLYLAVLEALLAPDSPVLGAGFEQHYLQTLPRWAAMAGNALGDAQRSRLSRGQAKDTLLLPFAYPGYHPRITAAPREVWLQVPSTGTARLVMQAPALERLALQQSMLALLQQWSQRFEELRSRWCERLSDSASDAFWRVVRSRHLAQTRCLLRAPSHNGSLDLPPTRTPAWEPIPTTRPLQDVRERLEQELARWERLRARAERPARGWEASLRRWWRGVRAHSPGRRERPLSEPAPASAASLPIDWDPAQYLALNIDVARSGIDPALHYLRFGLLEGRRYRA